jgi:hypothetical protein
MPRDPDTDHASVPEAAEPAPPHEPPADVASDKGPDERDVASLVPTADSLQRYLAEIRRARRSTSSPSAGTSRATGPPRGASSPRTSASS